MGSDNWLMAYVHLAHDCHVGSHTIFANIASLAGHVTIKDWVILGGFTLVHQFCIIGEHAMTAYAAGISQDVPPYVMASGYRAAPAGINQEGLKRRGFTQESIGAIKEAYKALYRQGLSYEAAKAAIIQQAQSVAELNVFVDFFAQSTRSIIR